MNQINSLFIVFGFLIFCGLSVLTVGAQTQSDIPSPQPGGESFGRQVAALPNGNFVVTDPNYDAGAIINAGRIYLYNGTTLALINTMTGSQANDFIGSNFSGRGITVLANGDYVVSSSSWNGNRGAVTRCSRTTGCPASISTGNSVVGSTADDFVGGDGVTALPSGNYVVRSSQWDNGGVANVGAIRWCSAAGCTGAVSAANSRVGSTVGDQIGLINIIVLSNGNYVSQDLFWDNGAATDAGAVSFCTGTAICAGVVSVSNSLIGTTVNEYTGNQGIYPLNGNGNYVVANDLWDNGAATDAGAATFCSGATGCTATVSMANSLVGTTTDDHISENQIAVLSNGNYVVRSGRWDNGGVADVGAATFCNGATGCVNTAVSTSNSLHGSTANDGVGGFFGVAALINGNYVVGSGEWDNAAASKSDVGASTWCNGMTGCAGPVTVGNSLIGNLAGTRTGFAVALTNGNYVVVSANITGAVTFCSGAAGCPGVEVSSANSLVGTGNSDFVGNITPLTNGNYVVTAPQWDNGATLDVGSATFCSGTAGCTGSITPANSFTGTAAGDQIGNGTIALAGGGYVIRSRWNNGVGAVTRCGTGGCTGTPSAANSLVGSTMNDLVGNDFNIFGLTALPNGNYIVRSVVWDNAGITDAGAISYGFGGGGTIGTLTVNNSVRGTAVNGGSDLNFSFDSTNNQLVVGRPADNIVTVFRPGAAPTAAAVTVGGRVVKFKGRGIANARVTLIDSGGNSRTTLTNAFGYYRFADVAAGATYTFSVTAKNQTFNQPTQVRSIMEDTDDVYFVADNQTAF